MFDSPTEEKCSHLKNHNANGRITHSIASLVCVFCLTVLRRTTEIHLFFPVHLLLIVFQVLLQRSQSKEKGLTEELLTSSTLRQNHGGRPFVSGLVLSSAKVQQLLFP